MHPTLTAAEVDGKLRRRLNPLKSLSAKKKKKKVYQQIA